MPPQPTGHPTLRNGLLYGGILAVLGLGNTLLQWLAGAYVASAQTMNGFTSVSVNDTGPSANLGCVVFLAMLALTFIAGMLTARSTGKVGAGALTGLIAGVFGTLVGDAISVVIIIAVVAPSLEIPAGSGMTRAQVQALLIGTTLAAMVLALVLNGGLGAGMGALGGLAGANSYRKSAPGYPPGYPAPAPGMYPGLPGQPGGAWPPGSPPYPPYPPSYPYYPPYPPSPPQPDTSPPPPPQQ